MRITLVVWILFVSVSGSAMAQGQSPVQIVWQLQNPFRYFKQAAHAEEHRKAFLMLTDQEKAEPVLSVERRLAAKNPQQGWAAAVFENVVDEACWYTHSAGGAPCGEYIKPQTHAIWLSAPALSGACSWQIAGQTMTSSDCRVPKAATVPSGAKTEVTLSTPNQAVVAKETIEVDDVLVVGLGDSFASGDGNPDRPVSFKRRRTVDYDNATQGYPRREPPEKAAGWVHRTCHRSLYSYQLRVALQLAIEDPNLHRSVTFVGLGCSGATILNLFELHTGYDEPPSADDKPHSNRKLGLSQLSILSHALCLPGEAKLDKAVDYNVGERLKLKDKEGNHPEINLYACSADKRLRNIDLLLLSVGGNDVGFSGLVANASLKKEELTLPVLFGEDPRISPEKARDWLRRFPGRVQALSEALVAVMGQDSPGRVILGAYPRMGFNEDGEPCGSGNRGFDVTNIWGLNGKVIAETEKFVEADLIPAMAKAAQDARWSFADAVRAQGKFRKQGICSSGDQEEPSAGWHNGRFPRYRYGGAGWAPYKPDQFMPYKARQRWFRTPNDAFMTAHYSDRTKLLPELRITIWSAYSGAFHPTAEGQAALADATMKLAREVLAKRPKR